MSKNYDGRVFLSQAEIRTIINALSVAAKQRMKNLVTTPFMSTQILESVEPEEKLIVKLNSYSQKLKGE